MLVFQIKVCNFASLLKHRAINDKVELSHFTMK